MRILWLQRKGRAQAGCCVLWKERSGGAAVWCDQRREPHNVGHSEQTCLDRKVGLSRPDDEVRCDRMSIPDSGSLCGNGSGVRAISEDRVVFAAEGFGKECAILSSDGGKCNCLCNQRLASERVTLGSS